MNNNIYLVDIYTVYFIDSEQYFYFLNLKLYLNKLLPNII